MNNICVNRIWRAAYVVVERANCPRPSEVVAGVQFRFPVSPQEEPRDPGSLLASPLLPRASHFPGSCHPAGIKSILFFILSLDELKEILLDSYNYTISPRAMFQLCQIRFNDRYIFLILRDLTQYTSRCLSSFIKNVTDVRDIRTDMAGTEL